MKSLIFILSFLLYSCASKIDQNNCKYYQDIETQMRIYTEVDIYPIYSKDDTRDFLSYILKEFKFPSQNELQTKTVVSFVIDKKGKVTNPIIFKKDTSQYTLFDKEAIRVIKNMPSWTPGFCNGKKVNTRIMRPVAFLLKK